MGHAMPRHASAPSAVCCCPREAPCDKRVTIPHQTVNSNILTTILQRSQLAGRLVLRPALFPLCRFAARRLPGWPAARAYSMAPRAKKKAVEVGRVHRVSSTHAIGNM